MRNILCLHSNLNQLRNAAAVKQICLIYKRFRTTGWPILRTRKAPYRNSSVISLTQPACSSESWICQSKTRLIFLQHCAGINHESSHKIKTNSESQAKGRFEGPGLSDFISDSLKQTPLPDDNKDQTLDDSYLPSELFYGKCRTVYFETYGCQMNVSDTEIAWSILQQNGFERVTSISQADIVLAVTCSIREGAEDKIWKRIHDFTVFKKRRSKSDPLIIGILGCMAERLKHKILEREKMVDVICGPDAYRDLPRLLTTSSMTKEAAVNVQLSLEETYADVVPVRHSSDSPSTFVSIMRGCDNMCTYCIVPFTRGRERSRPMTSIVHEVEALSQQGVKEVVLLGQNVNSYRDLSSDDTDEKRPTTLSAGFSTVYRPKTGGVRFARLLEEVAKVDREIRVRFTSPHPKDFPDEVLQAIAENVNICQQLHMPAQSGSTQVLTAMARGYTREAYLELVEHIRSLMPDIALSSDFIAGFCGETEEDHLQTLSLMEAVKYNYVYCFPYSMRQKTRAFHRLKDDVPIETKKRRHIELSDTFRRLVEIRHQSQIGQIHLVLVEGESKKSADDLAGRNDANIRVVFPDQPVSDRSAQGVARNARAGDYVAVQITSGTSQALKGQLLYITNLQDFMALHQNAIISLPYQHQQSITS